MTLMITPHALTRILQLDAAACAVMGAGLLALPLAAVTDLPGGLLTGAGALLLPVAAVIGFAARRPAPWLLRLVVLGNAAWVAASLLVLALAPMNGLGAALVLAQAAAVATLAALEYAGAAARRGAAS